VGTVFNLKAEVERRSLNMLHSAMGDDIRASLKDPAIVEIMLNPYGRLRIDRLAEGLGDTGKRLSPEVGELIVLLAASHVGVEATPASPWILADCREAESGPRVCPGRSSELHPLAGRRGFHPR
jgi:type IV secretion system protein VirB11